MTPPSVRFLGRKVYLAAVVILVSAMQQGPSAWRVHELSELFGADRITVYVVDGVKLMEAGNQAPNAIQGMSAAQKQTARDLIAEITALWDAVADLSLGNPCNEPPDEFFDHLKEESEIRTGLRHRYMLNPGYPEVREAVADHLRRRTDIPYEAGDICMTVGAAGAPFQCGEAAIVQ